MSKHLSPDTSDDRLVPPWAISGTEVVRGYHDGAIRVRDGGSVTIDGTHTGALHLERRANAIIRGTHQGSIHVSSKSHVTVLGEHIGSIHIAQGASLIVEQPGRITGALQIHGVVENHGVWIGPVQGTGSIRNHPGSTVRRHLTCVVSDER
ncbi:MAG: hypothetical protein EOO27_04880 [Comamonadaceae bacterium]|nr:MAG: hypothetical protein EOO27_04880 [Comamonadaceae bacterium]